MYRWHIHTYICLLLTHTSLCTVSYYCPASIGLPSKALRKLSPQQQRQQRQRQWQQKSFNPRTVGACACSRYWRRSRRRCFASVLTFIDWPNFSADTHTHVYIVGFFNVVACPLTHSFSPSPSFSVTIYLANSNDFVLSTSFPQDNMKAFSFFSQFNV